MFSAHAPLSAYLQLIRFNRPIGSLLLLWPTCWALWIAAGGLPTLRNLFIFSAGVFLMRSAGCTINDLADRHIDVHVERTQHRPVATGQISVAAAMGLAALLALLAFLLLLMTNRLTILLSVVGLVLATLYPFMKRVTHLPQVVLGAAFTWGVPMAFAAETNSLPPATWLLFCAGLVWTVVYDTFYAMIDRDDDLRVGVKSTAILFGDADRFITAALQGLVLLLLLLCGRQFSLGGIFYASVAVGAGLFAYQQWLIRDRERQACMRAFLNNNLFGLAIFAGLAADLQLS